VKQEREKIAGTTVKFKIAGTTCKVRREMRGAMIDKK
jgi:hypothetical protein